MKLMIAPALLLMSAGASAEQAYPPCSDAVTDSCIQLADLTAAERMKLREAAVQPAAGVGGPYEPIDDPVEEHAFAAPAPSNWINDPDVAASRD